MYTADLKLEHRERHRQQHKAHRHRKTLGAGMEEALKEGDEEAHNCTEKERKDNLNQRLHDNRNNVGRACNQRLGYAEGNGKENEADSVIKCNDGEQNIGKRPLCLVLADNHEGCGRGGCGGNGTKHDSRG